MEGVFKEQLKIRSSFRLELAGSGPGFDEVVQLSSEKKLDSNIMLKGVISGHKVSDLLERATAIIIVQENKSALQVLGKVFESLKAGKPIVGIMSKDCEAAEILRRSGLGFIHESHDIEGLRDTLIRLWEAWRENQPLVKPNQAVIQGFSLQRLPEKLTHVLQGVVDIPPSSGQSNLYEQKAGV